MSKIGDIINSLREAAKRRKSEDVGYPPTKEYQKDPVVEDPRDIPLEELPPKEPPLLDSMSSKAEDEFAKHVTVIGSDEEKKAKKLAEELIGKSFEQRCISPEDLEGILKKHHYFRK